MTETYGWVGAWSERRARLSPEAVGLVDATTGAEYTYADLDRRADRAARLLAAHGVERDPRAAAAPAEAAGGRVAVVSRNRPELVDCFFATGKTGGVLAPLSHRLAPPELAALLEQVDPRLLVVEAPFAARVARAVAEAAVDPPVLTLSADDGEDGAGADGDGSATGDGSGAGDAGGAGDDETGPPAAGDEPDPWADVDHRGRWADALPAADGPVETADLSPADPHLFLHTGGSTGLPKETVLTHGGVCWNSFNTITAWGLRPEDVTPMVFPMFHTGGWNVLTVPLFHLGAEVVVAREFDPEWVLRAVEDRGATVLVAVPAMFRMLTDHEAFPDADLGGLRFAKSGGGPCRRSVMEAWWDRGVDLSQGYGLTECGPNNFAMPDGWPREKADSIGVPAMHVDARVVDDGDPVEAGAVGELELRSPHAAAGYWRTPGETAATFGDSGADEDRAGEDRAGEDQGSEDASDDGSETADDGVPGDGRTESGDGSRGPTPDAGGWPPGGWVSTGDLARVDEAGYYYVEGRKKNMFVSGGENVYPAEVEDAVADHPKVAEVVVVGVPDDRWGTVGRAVVQGDESLTLDELRSFLEGRLAGYKVPRALSFVEELPTSGPSKIDRDAVAERFGGERDGTGE